MSITDLEQIDSILNAPQQSDQEFVSKIYPRPEVLQVGPLRWSDIPFSCMSTISGKNNCRAQTYIKVKGIPHCTKHALDALNKMLVECGIDQ